MLGLLLLATGAGVTAAAADGTKLARYLSALQPADLVPGADRFGQPAGGARPLVPVFKGETLAGHAYLTSDFVNTTGYSGRPIDVVVGLSPDGTVTGARLMDHHEPIVLIGIPPARINAFINGYVGKNVLELASQSAASPPVDIVSGATVTVMVIGDSIIRSGKKVMQALGHGTPADAATAVRKSLDLSQTAVEDWAALIGDGSVRRLTLTVGEVNAAFERTGRAEAVARAEAGEPDDGFIDLYAALVTVPAIGRSLLGDAEYESLTGRLKPGQQAILVAGQGRYSFKGSGYVRGGIFDRIELVQHEGSIRFRDRMHKRLGTVAAAGAPAFPEIGLFVLPETAEFDPTEPWRLQLLVQRPVAALDKVFVTFDLGYQLPDKYLKVERAAAPVATQAPAGPAAAAPEVATQNGVDAESADAAETPLWQRIWQSRVADIAVLTVAILLLTGIFFFQDQLVKRPALYERVRLGFLVFTLVWLGWYATAQLSVVNVLTFANALRSDFRWDYFLMDPLVFILWFSVAASLLFWGRGAFCGWLCPFGSLQELASKAAKRLGIRQVTVPFGLHQRLWPIKYMIFLLLFGLSLYSLASAEKAAEIEPFKTAIILHFVRDWWFVIFAAALLLAGLFIERFFCRYLCPLGAALAIPGRLRMFDWLKRYSECGSPCRRCANECPVQAIHPDGSINPNECIQCLHCQVLYHHDRKCPVMIQKRLKRERREAGSQTPEVPEPPAGPGRRRVGTVSTDPVTGTLSLRPRGH
ncbi:NosR/NirI family protein [Azospirillum picis]|uniref:NosR/NirI family nitrous oxide reductase transcriptional regulator n=1 Tax=Azospirillum picis TaxID=488438 RepID=A0ABU0MN48_9PROT|nr:NosR/NirI family protein [Azospirillum picis]MBP2301141.1 NosR/NirI family nitrous oxide reductase transcriptional regulator [Azospirillum picis]MDQ0534897.1 NosR/NirI family nitrous oxide reductase transcriptional regulator [Azospirillum picis]